MYEKTDKFIELYGEDMMQQIVECAWGNYNTDNVFITDKVTINAINIYFSGYFIKDGLEIGFDMESGNSAGDRVLRFGDEARGVDNAHPPKYIFKPDHRHESNEMSIKIFNIWKTQDWFIKKQNDMNYDFYFDPSYKTRKHYEDFAESKGMEISIQEDLIK
jgi:hypothetical protein